MFLRAQRFCCVYLYGIHPSVFGWLSVDGPKVYVTLHEVTDGTLECACSVWHSLLSYVVIGVFIQDFHLASRRKDWFSSRPLKRGWHFSLSGLK